MAAIGHTTPHPTSHQLLRTALANPVNKSAVICEGLRSVTCGGLFFFSMVNVAWASERAAHLVNSFQIMCTLEPVNFARGEERAAAMRLPVREDKRPSPSAVGYSVRSKSWLLPLKSGPHEFAVTEGIGPNGAMKGCGIGAPDADKDDFRAELIKTMKLARPIAERVSPDGTLSTTFWPYGSEGLELMFSARRDRRGIYLFLQTPVPK